MISIVLQFSDMLQSYCKSPSTEMDCLLALEEFASDSPDFAAIAKNAIHLLYELDVVSEDSILRWYRRGADGRDEDGDEEFAEEIRRKVKPLIEWLQEEDSSSEDEE